MAAKGEAYGDASFKKKSSRKGTVRRLRLGVLVSLVELPLAWIVWKMSRARNTASSWS